VPYLYSFSKEKLIIGKFCAIATDVKFITSSANHKLDGFSTYPFAIMGHGWEKDYDLTKLHNKGDTIIGNDVWFGYDSTIMPAVKIGDGAIIGSKAVVTKDVPPYAIVAGNPARIVKKRFSDETINELLKIKWWDWPKEKISRNIKAIVGADLKLLKQAK
jgi:virginiamycin A acetyltransferase